MVKDSFNSMMYAVPLSTAQQQQQQQGSSSNNNSIAPSSSNSDLLPSNASLNNPNNANSPAEWPGHSPSSNNHTSSSSLGSSWGPGLVSPSAAATMSDITNKPSSGSAAGVLSSSNNGSSADWSSSSQPASAAAASSSSSTLVWQTSPNGSGNEPGDMNKNSWSTAKNGVSGGGVSSSGGSGAGGGADKENQLPTTPVSTERTAQEVLIYRQGWGQVEVKQEVPWAVPESPPPVHEDPSVWKPRANTGTEVWEKTTGHRTQPWQNQAPNTPRWISGDERDEGPSSVWNGVGSGGGGAPGGSSQLMSSGGPPGLSSSSNGMMGMGGNSILSSNGPVTNRPNWSSSGPGSGGSGASSGGNISPTGGSNNNASNSNQWNDNVQDQEWSEWRDPSSMPKRENVNGTDLWGSSGQSSTQQNRSGSTSNSLYGGGNSSGGGGGGGMSNLNSDPRKSQSDNDQQQQQQRPRGWQDSGNYPGGPSSVSSQMQQQRSSSDWSSGGGGGGSGGSNDNEWRGSDNEKSSRSQWGGRDQHQQPQRPPSPPNNMRGFSREQIYQSKPYQGLLEMGFKREDIDTAMRNNNMNYEATLGDLRRRRMQQMQMQASLGGNSNNNSSSSSNSGFGNMGTGVGGPGGMMNGPGGGVPPQQQQAHQSSLQQQQQAGKAGFRGPGPAVPNIHALAQQLSVAAKQGIINPRLLNQPLAPQTTYLLHKLMGHHRQMQQLNAQHELLSMTSQKPSNPSLQQQQQQQLSQIIVHIQQTKKEIAGLQQKIDVMQNEYSKSPMDPRFQSGDLTNSSMSPPGFDFHTPSQVTPSSAASYNQGWRMPDPLNPYSGSVLGGGVSDSWGNSMAATAPNNFMTPSAFGAPQMMQSAPMWNDPNQWGMHGGVGGGPHGGGGMNNWRGMAPSGGSGGNAHNSMEDWAHMGMKSPGGPGGLSGGVSDALSPSRGGGGVTGNGSTGFGMDDTDGGNWGGNRQGNSGSFANSSANNSTFSAFAAWETLPEFEPGKPWRGSQLLSADEDPHLTPGSVQNKNPLMNAVTSGGSGGGGGGGGSGGGHYNADSQ